MHSALPVIGNHKLELASPCNVPWEAMHGDNRLRRCDQCDRNVYNLAQMSADELVTLIERTEGRFCGRLFQREDGTLLTQDCPVGLARALRRAKRRTLLGTAALVTALSAAAGAVFGWGSEKPKVVQKVVKRIEKITPPPEPVPVAGGIRPIPVHPIPVHPTPQRAPKRR